MDEIIQKLDSLRKKYPDAESTAMISDWEKSAKIAVITANLQENDGMKMIIEKYQSEVESLNKTLIENENLFKDEEGVAIGKLIHARKKWCNDFLRIFKTAKSRADGINRTIDKALKTDED